jgi:ASCH domain
VKRVQKRRAPKIRWTRALKKCRALTVRQPWAWLIVNGYKDVENRSWATRQRGDILIHAGMSKTDLNESVLKALRSRFSIHFPNTFLHGGVIGVVEILDCKKGTSSRWHQCGLIGWVLAEPRRLPYRKCKGALSLYKPKFKLPPR